MKVDQAIRSIVSDPKFEAIIAVAEGLKEEWNESGNSKKDTIEATGMNTTFFSGKVVGLDEFFERLKQLIKKEYTKDEDNG